MIRDATVEIALNLPPTRRSPRRMTPSCTSPPMPSMASDASLLALKTPSPLGSQLRNKVMNPHMPSRSSSVSATVHPLTAGWDHDPARKGFEPRYGSPARLGGECDSDPDRSRCSPSIRVNVHFMAQRPSSQAPGSPEPIGGSSANTEMRTSVVRVPGQSRGRVLQRLLQECCRETRCRGGRAVPVRALGLHRRSGAETPG